LPPLDQGMAALLDDLAASSQFDETMVTLLGEFGRSPKINSLRPDCPANRDHWGWCFFGLFAGGGVQGGQAVGRSDKEGGQAEDARASRCRQEVTRTTIPASQIPIKSTVISDYNQTTAFDAR
jgi:uncharacterized protein (DUF1501 family)